jgi:PEP-CTERM motif
MIMKRTSLMIAALIALTGVAQGVQIWDIANNSVTDSRTIVFNTPGTATISDILKFNSASAVAAGEVAGSYVLTSVVLTISGSDMSGTFEFNNTFGSAGTVTFANYAAGQGLTFTAAGATTIQTMTHAFNGGVPYAMAPFELKSETFAPTMGAAGSSTISTGLDAFTGTGNLESSSASLAAQMSDNKDAGIFSGSLANGTAGLSITYNYTLVPEPTSMALLAIGCAVLGLRRRNRAQKV